MSLCIIVCFGFALQRSMTCNDRKVSLTLASSPAAASLRCDELPPELGQAGFQETQVVGCGLVLLRPGHLPSQHSTQWDGYLHTPQWTWWSTDHLRERHLSSCSGLLGHRWLSAARHVPWQIIVIVRQSRKWSTKLHISSSSSSSSLEELLPRAVVKSSLINWHVITCYK